MRFATDDTLTQLHLTRRALTQLTTVENLNASTLDDWWDLFKRLIAADLYLDACRSIAQHRSPNDRKSLFQGLVVAVYKGGDFNKLECVMRRFSPRLRLRLSQALLSHLVQENEAICLARRQELSALVRGWIAQAFTALSAQKDAKAKKLVRLAVMAGRRLTRVSDQPVLDQAAVRVMQRRSSPMKETASAPFTNRDHAEDHSAHRVSFVSQQPPASRYLN